MLFGGKYEMGVKSPCQVKTMYGDLFFILIKSRRRRSMAIQISVDSSIKVSVPYRVSQEKIVDFIQEKSFWIFDRLAIIQKKYGASVEKRFLDGHSFLFLGKKCRLEVVAEVNVKRGACDFDGSAWKISVPRGLLDIDREKLSRELLMKWYKEQAKEVIGGRIFHYGRIMNVEPNIIEIRTQKRVWGNCNVRHKTIHINWHIILAPFEVIDYVVVHEMCHLIHPNHSKKFWLEVQKFMPDYRERKKWLSKNILEMKLPD